MLESTFVVVIGIIGAEPAFSLKKLIRAAG